MVIKAMQATEKFYNVLWWSKNARHYRRINLIMKAPRVWDIIRQKHFEALCKSMPAHVEAVLEAKGSYTRCRAKSFVAVAMW